MVRLKNLWVNLIKTSVAIVTKHSQTIFRERIESGSILWRYFRKQYFSSRHIIKLFRCIAALLHSVPRYLSFWNLQKVFFDQNESSMYPANHCDSSCNHWWPLTPVPFYQTSLTSVTAGNMCMARNTQLPDVLYGTTFLSTGCGKLWHWSSQYERKS